MSGQPPASGVVNVVGDVVQHVASGSETSCELSALGCSKENIDINILSPSKVPVSYRYEESQFLIVIGFLFRFQFWSRSQVEFRVNEHERQKRGKKASVLEKLNDWLSDRIWEIDFWKSDAN